MKLIDKRILLVRNLLSLIAQSDTFTNRRDIRSVTIHSLAQAVQNYWFSLSLSKSLLDIHYCNENISERIKKTDLRTINHNFSGFIKNGFFITSFLIVENHIRLLAVNFERTPNDINQTSILTTFKNLINERKTEMFKSLTTEDFKLFEFYCHLRNTVHNNGIQTQSDSIIIIHDIYSVFNKKAVEIKLVQNSHNDLSFENLILIKEQVFKLIIKMNSFIHPGDFIEHNLADRF